MTECRVSVFNAFFLAVRRVSLALVLAVALIPAYAADAQDSLGQLICKNLAIESQKVLDDTDRTSKYLSPYIADEIYQQVLSSSVADYETAGGVVNDLPRMANLPCADTVSGFLMAIKKRMEYNRVDHFVVGNRIPLTVALIVFVMIIYFWRRFMPLHHKRDSES